MPTIEISRKDLGKLTGKNLSSNEIADLLSFAKATLESEEGDALKVESADVNRPDLWSAEGIARVMKGQLGLETGIPEYSVAKGNYALHVDKKVEKVRPLIACAVVKNLSLSTEAIRQLIQLQEKLCENFGLHRKEAALGIYDFDKIEWPVTYTAYAPGALKFMPLGMGEELTLKEILQRHEKGRQYAPLLQDAKEYPILIDSSKQVLSMPPIINSDHTGRVTEKTNNVFIEVTGNDYRFVIPVLNIMLAALAERGGKIFSVVVEGNEKIIFPNLNPVKVRISAEYCNAILGLHLKPSELEKLLKKARYDAKVFGPDLLLEYLPYRQDIMDARDIIEDIAIAYGYSNLKSEPAHIATVGNTEPFIALREKITELLIGMNMQEIATFTLTNKESLFKKMNAREQEVIELLNPVSSLYSCLRHSLIPSSLEFLSRNIKREFPQKIFEIGECFDMGRQATTRKLLVAVTHKDANFTELKQILSYVLDSLQCSYSVHAVPAESFIDGRAGIIIVAKKPGKKEHMLEIGIIGEIHPKVLSSWSMETPCSVFEIDMSQLETFLNLQ